MKKLLKIFGFIVVGLVILVIALPFIIPSDYIFNQVTQAVEKTTGRTLTIKGQQNLSVFPKLSLELNDVHFANMPNGSSPDMVSMQQLAVHIPYMSALFGDIKLETFVIREPNILLEKMPDGRVNWQLFESVKQAPKNEEKSSESSTTGLPKDFDIALGEVAIYGGTFTYIDHQTNKTSQLSDLDLTIQLPSIRKPLLLDGSVTYMEEKFQLETQLETPEKVINGDDFNLSAVIDAALLKMDFKGAVVKAGSEFSGELVVNGDSVKRLLRWQNIAIEAKDNALNQFAFSGKAKFSEQKLVLSELKATLDKLDIKGQANIDLGERLNIMANADLGELNVNPYLPESIATEQPVQEQGEAKPIVWDKTTIDLSALTTLDANIKLRSQAFKFKEIKLGENALSLKLNNGLATIGLDKFNAYEGMGTGKVVVNAAKVPYVINTSFELTGMQAEPLLKDAAAFDKLMGQGSLNWALSTSGQSQHDFVNGLGGELGFSFLDGAVKGANLAAMVRQAKSLISGGGLTGDGLEQGYDNAKKTDFSELTGKFVFDSGISRENELLLKSPLLRVTGKGDVHLPNTKLNYRLVTGIVDSIEGQGTTDKSTGFKIPARIKGPFHDVKVKLDIKDAAKEEAKDKIKDKVKNKLKNLFG